MMKIEVNQNLAGDLDTAMEVKWMSPVDEASAIRKRQAEHPRTSPKRLATLLSDGNYWVRRSALSNPACPDWAAQLLVKAGARSDMSSIDRAGLKQPLNDSDIQQLLKLKGWSLELLAAHPDTPAEVLEVLASHDESVRRLVASHQSASSAVLGRLMLDDSESVRLAADGNAKAPFSVRVQIEQLMEKRSLNVGQLFEWMSSGGYARKLIAAHPQTPWVLLERLLKDGRRSVREIAARHPNIHQAAQLNLSEKCKLTGDDDMALALSQNSAVTDQTLASLVTINHTELRQRIAVHSAVGEKTLLWLATDGNGEVRLTALKHPSFNVESLQLLVRAGSTPDLMQFGECDQSLDGISLDRLSRMGLWGQRLAARHPGTPAEAIKRLCTHADPLIRLSASQNPGLDRSWLKQFTQMGTSADLQEFIDPDVTDAPVATVDHREQLSDLAELDLWARQVLARHPDAGLLPGVLPRLLEDEPIVRKHLAENTCVAAEDLLLLVNDASPDIRWVMVRRDDLSLDQLEQLSLDPVPAIREVAEERLGILSAV